MATTVDHLAQANHNQDVIEALLDHPAPFWDWVAIVAFYKAVHVAEAVFYEKEPRPYDHSTAHKDRNRLLKTRYPQLWRQYWHLFKASKAARYLEYEDGGQTHSVTRFSDYMPERVVKRLLLGRYLVQFENAAIVYLPPATPLNRFAPR